jgi:tRNA (guanine-N7-)-methyltransferase
MDSGRFYGRRQGRALGAYRRHLMENLLPSYQIQMRDSFDPEMQYQKPVWLEIGFGAGEHLCAQAKRHSDAHFIGCEAFSNGVASMLGHIDREELSNVSIYPNDVRPFLKTLKGQSISRAFILFPDPWPKKRHHKRRLINPILLDELARLLKPGAKLVIASDHEKYAEQVMDLLSKHPEFALPDGTQDAWQLAPADWVETRYEARGKRLGHKIHYLFNTRF